MHSKHQLILASSSARRQVLLASIDISPDKIIAPEIDERPIKGEKPEFYTKRIAKEKAIEVASQTEGEAFILAADTIVATKAKIFAKAENIEQVRNFIEFFSGRKVKVHTAISVIKVKESAIEKISTKLVTSSLKFKRLTKEDIDLYISRSDPVGKAGGFVIQNYGETLLEWINGSYSGIIGLPLTQTLKLLRGMGYNDLAKS